MRKLIVLYILSNLHLTFYSSGRHRLHTHSRFLICEDCCTLCTGSDRLWSAIVPILG